MPLRTSISSNSIGPSYDLEISVVESPNDGPARQSGATVKAEADASKWKLDKESVQPAADQITSTSPTITLVWLNQSISAQEKTFRFTLEQLARRHGAYTVQAEAHDPVQGDQSSDSWTA